MFDAMLNGRIDTEGLEFEVVFKDIEELNAGLSAAEGVRPHISKASYAVLPQVADRYCALRSGSALGRGNGPLLVAGDESAATDDCSMRIAVPGVPSGNVTATMTNGTLTRKGDIWEARPSKVGTDAVISVNARMADGRSVEMAKNTFRVRALPDPMPYIEYKDQNGNMRKFRGGNMTKRNLIETEVLQAAIDDEILNIKFDVLRFELLFFDSMGNAIPEVSQGPRFSDNQKDRIRRLTRGKRFFIRGVVAKGPDGLERTLTPIEVIVN